jgi:predicted nucleotidyltransferase
MEPMGRYAEAMHPLLARHLEEIVALCRQFGVERLEVFGSICTDEFDPERSDVDFLVRYPDNYDYGPWLGRVQEFERALAALLYRDVDVVMDYALRKPRFAEEAGKTRLVIYDACAFADVA